MSAWILLAIGGHILNAVAFIIDKILLHTAFKKSATYAAMIGSLSLVTLVAVPWVDVWPSGREAIASIAFGGVFVFALWAFFEALRLGEATRVVPVVGSLIPVFTFLGARVFLGEELTSFAVIAFSLLLLATALLSGGARGNQGLPKRAIAIGVLSACLFAASSLAGKFAFTHASFLGVFLLSRGIAGVAGLSLLFVPGVVRELNNLLRPKITRSGTRSSIGLALLGQVSGAVGFILVQWALSLGSASLVNALQAVQYAFIVLVAWFGGRVMQEALQERVTLRGYVRKGFAILLTGVGLACLSFTPTAYPKEYGFTWSSAYAQFLGIEPVYGLQTVLRELRPTVVRLPVYWNEVEPERNQYRWGQVDKMVQSLVDADVKIQFVVGLKQPRWPECWFPAWTKTLSEPELQAALKTHVQMVVARYNPHATLWQVENEPTFPASFGECGRSRGHWLEEELAWVAASSSVPMSTSMSGELSTWRTPSTRLQALGVSLYRVISTPIFPRFSYWFLPSWSYDLRAWLLSRVQPQIMYVSEFQMEPWIIGDVRTLSLETQFRTFDLNQMQKNFVYAEQLRMKTVLFWGVEWWLWMKEQRQRPEFMETASAFFRSHH